MQTPLIKYVIGAFTLRKGVQIPNRTFAGINLILTTMNVTDAV